MWTEGLAAGPTPEDAGGGRRTQNDGQRNTIGAPMLRIMGKGGRGKGVNTQTRNVRSITMWQYIGAMWVKYTQGRMLGKKI